MSTATTNSDGHDVTADVRGEPSDDLSEAKQSRVTAANQRRRDEAKKQQPKQDEKDDHEDGDSDEEDSDDETKFDEKDEDEPEPWSTAKKVTVFSIIGGVVLVAAILALVWWLHARQFEKTDDAFIDAHNERVAPQVAGRVIAVHVDDNAVVEKNKLLFEIDPRDYQAALDQALGAIAEAKGMVAQAKSQKEVAVANVEQAKADLEAQQATLDNQQAQLTRYEKLSREAVSPQRLDDLRTAVRNAAAQVTAAGKRVSAAVAQIGLAESQIEAAEAQVKSAQARVEIAELNLSYTKVVANSGGRVTERNVQVGDYVAPGGQVMILVPTDVYVTANFKETQLTDMKAGQDVTIKVDAFPDAEFKGHVESFQAGAGQVFSLLPPENATGNYVKVVQRVPVKIVFDDKNSDAYKRLGPGMSVVPAVKVR